MKTGRPLAEIAAAIKQTAEERKDFFVPTTQLRYVPDEHIGRVEFKVGKNSYAATPTNHCLNQIARRIPAKYLDQLKGEGNAPLLAQNINWWWKHDPGKHMLRTLLNGHHVARAFLSNIYRPLENADLATAVFPKLAALKCEILSCEITETRLYIQAATPKVEAKMVGDTVRAGCIISNSEVGQGAIWMDPMLYTLSCKNGAVMPRVMRHVHIGRRSDPMFELDQAAEYYTDATRQADDKAFWMKVSDVVDGLFDPTRFGAMVEQFENTAKQKINGVEAVEEITERYSLNEDEKNAVLNHLIEGGNRNLYGLINAVTRTASDVESYDRSIELQRIGGSIMELPKTLWQSRN
jgi:hypothetical protein